MNDGRRKLVAVLALAGFFLSSYLLLYALGFYGDVVCGQSGSCEAVQTSRYARFLGVPVAGWGTAWYLAVFAVAIAALQPGAAGKRWPDRGLAVLAAGGLAFSLWLTYAELFLIRAICRLCVASAALTVLIFAATLPLGRASSGGGPEALEGRSVR
ncbi:MAG: vitamin K epoxide reductase family protein [Gemmatimonadota bacterium]